MKFKWNVRKIEIENFDSYIPDDELFDWEKYEEVVDFKCLNYDVQEELDYDIVLEWANFNKDDYPVFYCTKCNKPHLVPLDVYNQIKKKS